jgi:hypothetical protein
MARIMNPAVKSVADHGSKPVTFHDLYLLWPRNQCLSFHLRGSYVIQTLVYVGDTGRSKKECEGNWSTLIWCIIPVASFFYIMLETMVAILTSGRTGLTVW